MFEIGVPAVPYSPPWDVPFEERCRWLRQGSRRVVYLYDVPEPNTFRYRVYNMVQALRASGRGTSATYLWRKELAGAQPVLDQADVLVVCRCRYQSDLNRAIERAKRNGKRVLFDVDDLVVDPGLVHSIVNTLDLNVKEESVWNEWFACVSRLRATMDLCDSILTTNEFLGDSIQALSGKRYDVIPNFMNREQVEISEQIMARKRRLSFDRRGPFVVGYFSGTPSHAKDFEVVADALSELLERSASASLRLAGHIELPRCLERHRQRIEFCEFRDYVNLQRLIGETELNIVPLQDNLITNCKSELKFFEAGAVGTLTIASPTRTYAKCIRNGVNGYLAKPYEWLDRIQQVMENMDAYASLAEEAYKDSIGNYCWERFAEPIERVLFGNPEHA
jgi:glycosyltransferase involved in cell wall biosynthesis